MNECPSGIHRLEQSVNSVSQILPLEWQAPSTFYDFHTTTLFQSLVAISQEAPELESLAAAVMKEELQLIEKIHAKDISKSNFITLSRITESLPSLPSSIGSEPLIDPNALALFGHDTGIQYIVVLDNTFLHYRNRLPLLSSLNQRICYFNSLHHQYQRPQSENPTLLTHAYAKLMKVYVEKSVLPEITNTLHKNIPIGIFQLYEMRSAYRELVGLDPKLYATTLPLRTTLEEFIETQKFEDKNTRKPVKVQFTEDCSNPLVFIDPGDLFRMTRNLLRDAVTHGEGVIITPLIHIAERDGYVEYSIYSPGHLDKATLAIIGRQPYTTRNRGERLHGYGKVGARKLLTALWKSLGTSPGTIESLLKHHWSNTTLAGSPFVRWSAPLPMAA